MWDVGLNAVSAASGSLGASSRPRMTPHLTIRIATREDAPAIAALSRDEIEHGLPWTWREARVRNAIADPDTNVIEIGRAHV